MAFKAVLAGILVSTCLSVGVAQADSKGAKKTTPAQQPSTPSSTNLLDELNPFDPNIEQKLREYDKEQERATGMPSHLEGGSDEVPNLNYVSGCYREQCEVFAYVSKEQQKMYLYVDGQLVGDWLVSTGARGHRTPDFDRNPNGRIYDRYTSKAYPGGDYQGLGNMPYAVFIQGGFAIHGTAESNWPKLGSRASHGCIRLHPDNAYYFNRLVRERGVKNVWITVQD